MGFVQAVNVWTFSSDTYKSHVDDFITRKNVLAAKFIRQ